MDRRILCHQEKTARPEIEAMHDPGAHWRPDGAEGDVSGQKCVHQSSPRPSCPRVHRKASRLHDHEKPFVFVHDLEGAIFGGKRGRRSREVDLQNLPGTKRVSGLNRTAFDANQPLIDQALHLRSGEMPQSGFESQPAFQKAVQSNSGLSPRHPVTPVGQPVPPGWDLPRACSGSSPRDRRRAR